MLGILRSRKKSRSGEQKWGGEGQGVDLLVKSLPDDVP